MFDITDNLDSKDVEFVSISDKIDTTTSAGKVMFGMLAVFAEFKRNIIRERTRAGLQAARKRGRIGGRPTLEATTKRRIITLFEAGESATDIAKEYNIGRSPVYKVINEVKKQS